MTPIAPRKVINIGSTNDLVPLSTNSMLVMVKYLIWSNDRWLVFGHVTGINSATTTCQPRPANHDLCVSLAFKPIKKSVVVTFGSLWCHSHNRKLGTDSFNH